MAAPEIRVAIMQPKYQINLGYMARVAKNFGITELYLIKPRCKWDGKQAIQYSKHANELLKGAKICKTLEEASDGFFLIGTTGLWRKSSASFYNAYSLDDTKKMVSKNGHKKICILIGRDDIGLTKEEIAQCDAMLYVPADIDYPVLNISHALAIILSAFYEPKGKGPERSYVPEEDLDPLVKMFYRSMEGNERIRDKPAIARALRRILKRAKPTKREVNALYAAFAKKED
jgi:tRNA/rRNA methyltransferase